jgi:hypothetical protein
VRYKFRNEVNNLISNILIVNRFVHHFLSFIRQLYIGTMPLLQRSPVGKRSRKLLDWRWAVKGNNADFNSFLSVFKISSLPGQK